MRSISARPAHGPALLLALSAVLTQPVFATVDPAPREQLEALRERITELRQTIEAKSGEKTALSRHLREAESEIGRRARKLRVLDGRLVRQRERLDELNRRLAGQHQQMQAQRAALARQVRTAYAMGRQERIKILLNQQDPALISRAMVYYDYLSRARAAKMAEIRADTEKLRETEREIRVEEQALAGLHELQAAELATLRESQEARREVVARLTRELGDEGRRLDRLVGDEQRLQSLLDGLEQALSDIPVGHPQAASFGGLRGRLPWPTQGRVTTRFGAPRLGSLVWDGVMIAAPEGREVRAVHHGRVAFADWLRGFGLLLIVDHGDGYMTLYGHNQSLFKEVGDWVDTDEPIALVGASGGRDQPGVYFGIRHQGRPVDPARWCQRASRGRVG